MAMHRLLKSSTIFLILTFFPIQASREGNDPFADTSAAATLATAEPLEMLRVFQTLGIASQVFWGLERLFHPPEVWDPDEATSMPSEIPGIAMQVLNPPDELRPLLGHARHFIGAMPLTGLGFKSSESQAIQALLVRVAMVMRPHYFASEITAEGLLPNAGHKVFSRFVREFAQGGALDSWSRILKDFVTHKSGEENVQLAVQELIDYGAWFIKYIGSDAVDDPLRNPLDKYATQDEIREIMDLEDWLEKNPSHPAYDERQHRFQALHESLLQRRSRVLRESGEYMSSLFRRMALSENTAGGIDDLLREQEEEEQRRRYTEFAGWVLAYAREDSFEPVPLRNFWEGLVRNRYGPIFYRVVCEGVEGPAADLVHQRARQIWQLSLIDTIHENPKESKSRMPDRARDGRFAPNFGYVMGQSESYAHWSANPFALTYGDIIMDRFSDVVEFGNSLNIGTFLGRLNMELMRDRSLFLDPDPYDHFLIPFELYLLEKVFHSPFVCGEDRTIPGELVRVADEHGVNILETASNSLREFQAFSRNMSVLLQGAGTADSRGGLVFGIGFSGPLFGEQHKHENETNKIFVSFSESGRTRGGQTFIRFLMEEAFHPRRYPFSSETIRKLVDGFERYKCLMRQHIEREIKEDDKLLETPRERSFRDYIAERNRLHTAFLSQLKEGRSFKDLDESFQSWIRDSSNWYRLPRSIEVKAPDEMPLEEYEAQHSARELLFDALNRYCFSQAEKYSSVIPLLFLHWKDEVAEILSDQEEVAESVRVASNLEALPEDMQITVLEALDNLVIRVHPELERTLQPDIDRIFADFMKPAREPIDAEISGLQGSIRGLHKKLRGLSKARTDVSVQKEATENELARVNEALTRAELEIQALPQRPRDLPASTYEAFKAKFFENREVYRCMEPLFARVLGSDHFFAVYIANEAARGPLLHLGNEMSFTVIAPCDKRCQHHALGHLYVGDLLTPLSVDSLDLDRRTHGLEGVPDRFMIPALEGRERNLQEEAIAGAGDDSLATILAVSRREAEE